MPTEVLYSPRGNTVRFPYREGTSDLSIAGSHLDLWGSHGDEYRLRDLRLAGTAVDVGALNGAVTASLLADNPDLAVVAIEPLPENCEVIAQLLRLNGWTDRCRIVNAGIAPGDEVQITYGNPGTDFAAQNRYVGNMRAHATLPSMTVPATSLSALLDEPPQLVVTDCEGCEWELFSDPLLLRTEHVIGEWHWGTAERVHEALDATHEVRVEPADDLTSIGLFWAVLR